MDKDETVEDPSKIYLDETVEDPSKVYLAVALSFPHGILRLTSARAGYLRYLSSNLAIMAYRTQPREDHSGQPVDDILRTITMVSPEQHSSLEYISNLSRLVYATTLLDTFLHDTTRFLLLSYPASIGKNQTVTVDVLLASQSRAEVITKAANKRAREIAYLPFQGRVEFLRSAFGLNIDIDETSWAALEHYSGVRNVAVHDQGSFEIELSEKGKVVIRQKACFLHPTIVSENDLDKAIKAYKVIYESIAGAVLFQVLKASETKAGKVLMDIFLALRDDSPSSIEDERLDSK